MDEPIPGRSRRISWKGNARARTGQTLFISAMAAILVAAQIYVVTLVTNQSYRRTDKVRAQLRAHFIAQSAFSRLCSRLAARPWSDRWFRDAPATEAETPLEGGSYSSLTETVPDSERLLADVWIRARSENSQVLMFWRVQYTRDGFDLEPRVQLDFFSYLTGAEDLPVPGTGGPLRDEVARMLEARRRHANAALRAATGLAGTTRLEEVLQQLGIRPEGVPLDEVPASGGGDSVPQSAVIEASRSGRDRVLAPPPPPDAPEPPDVGSERARRLLRDHAFPGGISAGVVDAL